MLFGVTVRLKNELISRDLHLKGSTAQTAIAGTLVKVTYRRVSALIMYYNYIEKQANLNELLSVVVIYSRAT